MGINEKPIELKPADYASDQEVRWCPVAETMLF